MKHGFTLTEMLVALALTAIAIAIISEGVRQTIGFQGQLQSVREARETRTATLEAVRARLEQLVAAESTDANDETGILFEGQSRRIVFLSADPGYPSAAGVYEYTLVLTGGDDEDVDPPAPPQLILIRRSLTNLSDFGRTSDDARSWTLPLSEPLVFGYAGPDSPPAAAWHDAARYPSLVTLSADEGEAPALSVRLPRIRRETGGDPANGEATQ